MAAASKTASPTRATPVRRDRPAGRMSDHGSAAALIGRRRQRSGGAVRPPRPRDSGAVPH